MLAAALFASHAAKMKQVLAAHGYKHVFTNTDEAFGSHRVEFRNDDASLSLVWDGKEEWLRLVACKHDASAEEMLFRNLRGSTDAEHERALADAIAMTHHFIAPHHHDDDDDVACVCSHHHS